LQEKAGEKEAEQVLKMASWVRSLQWISRLTRISILFFWGRFGLPIPFRVPLLYAVGAPIRVPRLANNEITQEQIDVIHEKFLEAMAQLHAKYKGTAGLAAQNHLKIL